MPIEAINHKEVLGKEPINMTLSLSLCSPRVSGFAFVNNPDRNPVLKLEPKPFPRKSKAPLLSLWVSPMVSPTLRWAPQWQSVSFLKQALWNSDSQEGHFSTSPS